MPKSVKTKEVHTKLEQLRTHLNHIREIGQTANFILFFQFSRNDLPQIGTSTLLGFYMTKGIFITSCATVKLPYLFEVILFVHVHFIKLGLKCARVGARANTNGQ